MLGTVLGADVQEEKDEICFLKKLTAPRGRKIPKQISTM